MDAPLSYVLPFKAAGDEDLEELASYVRSIAVHAEVIVVDGSIPEAFERHHKLFGDTVRHLAPRSDLSFSNGKVNGLTTGVEVASAEKVVVADDDIRYDLRTLERMSVLLEEADLVRPQNYFDPRPWHAHWDTGRTLLNRAFGRDYPGTFGIRRSFFLAVGGYDGDVLFENLEMIRTMEVAGGRSITPLDLYVRRLPPTTQLFWQQRVRQAYDDLAQPWRVAVFLPLAPLLLLGLVRSRAPILVVAGAIVAAAEGGRRRAGGRAYFTPVGALAAPFWVVERALCLWPALGARIFRGGVRYRDGRLRVAAHSRRWIRRRLRERSRL